MSVLSTTIADLPAYGEDISSWQRFELVVVVKERIYSRVDFEDQGRRCSVILRKSAMLGYLQTEVAWRSARA